MAFCFQCSQGDKLMEFPTVRALNEHIKSGHKTRPEGWQEKERRITLEEAEKHVSVDKTPISKRQGKVEKESAPPKRPIELMYRYIGQCPDCGEEIETITVNVGAKDSLVAYCSSCKKQYKEIKVTPIQKQT